MTIRTAKDFGQLIRRYRRARGWTQAELAARCGTGERFIVDLESGKPTAHLGKALAAAYETGLHLDISPPDNGPSGETGDDLSFLPKFD